MPINYGRYGKMSSAIIKTGFVLGGQEGKTANEIYAIAKVGRFIAVSRTVRKTIAIHMPHVAMDTGFMRAALDKYLKSQIIRQVNHSNMVIQMRVRDVQKLVDYIQYHWGKGPTGKDIYIQPTTKGTYPINPKQWIMTMKKLFPVEIEKVSQKLGFNVLGVIR